MLDGLDERSVRETVAHSPPERREHLHPDFLFTFRSNRILNYNCSEASLTSIGPCPFLVRPHSASTSIPQIESQSTPTPTPTPTLQTDGERMLVIASVNVADDHLGLVHLAPTVTTVNHRGAPPRGRSRKTWPTAPRYRPRLRRSCRSRSSSSRRRRARSR